ncbi:hypothetical protein GYMLUDRAFT_240696 [Collybiopsis luxurians FD-317 M1]|nr:hypothetical protein GYMLUDRAFT_240696 [Collybiopsis luxurians FD-317 M1]
MNATNTALDVDVAIIVGPLLVAVMLNTFLYGLCLLQFITYFTSGTQDRMAIKFMIAWELFIDTAHSILSVYMLWAYVIDNFGNKAYLRRNPWHLTFPPTLTPLSACPIQIFLAYRVKRLSGSRIVFIVLVILTLIECMPHILLAKESKWTSTVSTAETEYLVSRFIREAVETGSFATLFAISLIITVADSQNQQWKGRQLIFMVFSIPIGRIYTNTFLAILNSRQNLRRELHDYSYTKSSVTQNSGSSPMPVSREQGVSQSFIVGPSGTGTSGATESTAQSSQGQSIVLTEVTQSSYASNIDPIPITLADP